VILTADDENLIIELVARAVLGLLQADVVVRIGRIPVQPVRNRATRNARPNNIGAVRGLLAVDDQPVVHRCVCAYHDIVGADHVPVARRNARRLTVHNFLGVNAGIDLSSVAENRACQAFQVLERMKGCLAREAKRRTAVPEAEGNAIDQLGVVDSGAMRRLELSLELLSLAVAAEKEVAFDTLKIAIDVLH